MIWLHNARFLSAFAVVWLHVCAPVVLGTQIGSADWWSGNIYDSLVRWCVPVFVMISGALLLDTRKTETAASFFRKRLTRILIPLLFWSAFYMAFDWGRSVIWGRDYGSEHAAMALLAGRPYYHMWFLFMIATLYVVTPYLRKVVLLSSRSELWLLTATLFVLAAGAEAGQHHRGGPPVFFGVSALKYLPYFLLGHLMVSTPKRGPMLPFGVLAATAVVLTAFLSHLLSSRYGLQQGLYPYDYLSVTVIPMALGVFRLLQALDRPLIPAAILERLATVSFGIYLIHPFILDVLRSAFSGLPTVGPQVTIPVLSLLTFGLAAAATFLLARIPYLKRIV